MLKSILNYKIFFFFILNVFVSIGAYAQIDIQGRWKTSSIIGFGNVKEYSLIKEKEPSYTRGVTFNLDGTFLSDESIQCLSDCFVFTSGTYALTDDYHIRMIVEKVSLVGLLCGMRQFRKEDIIRDLGTFYIDKDGDSLKLIPSNGVLQDDRDKILYAQVINTFNDNWKSYDFLWQDVNGDNPEQIIKDCIDNSNLIDLSSCKVVLSGNVGYGKLFLLREKEDFYYVIYDSYIKKVSLAYPKKKI